MREKGRAGTRFSTRAGWFQFQCVTAVGLIPSAASSSFDPSASKIASRPCGAATRGRSWRRVCVSAEEEEEEEAAVVVVGAYKWIDLRKSLLLDFKATFRPRGTLSS